MAGTCDACKNSVNGTVTFPLPDDKGKLALCSSCNIVASRIKNYLESILFLVGQIHGDRCFKKAGEAKPQADTISFLNMEIAELKDELVEKGNALKEWFDWHSEIEKIAGKEFEPELLTEVFREMDERIKALEEQLESLRMEPQTHQDDLTEKHTYEEATESDRRDAFSDSLLVLIRHHKSEDIKSAASGLVRALVRRGISK